MDNDKTMYTGVDGGIFGNEARPKDVEDRIREQEKLINELKPQLQELIDIIDNEIKSAMSIKRFISATTQNETDIRAELQAAALYEKYLEALKTRFTLALNETKKYGRKKGKK